MTVRTLEQTGKIRKTLTNKNHIFTLIDTNASRPQTKTNISIYICSLYCMYTLLIITVFNGLIWNSQPSISVLTLSVLLMLPVPGMDQISIKTPNPKCRLYWCLIEFIYWRYSQSWWYFRPLLWTSASLTFSPTYLPPPFPVWISTKVCIHTVFKGGGDMGPQTDKHLSPSTFTGQFLRKADI